MNTTPIQLYQGRKDNKGTVSNIQEAIDLIQGATFKPHIEKLRRLLDELKHLKSKLENSPAAEVDEWQRLVSKQQELCDNHKGQLLAVTWSGTFSSRKATLLLQYSQLICLDIDKVANVQELFENISQWQYTFICFISPSGEGIKVIVKTDIDNSIPFSLPAEHKRYFLALRALLITEFNIENEFDDSGKDISRLCFLTYFPRLVHNLQATVFSLPKEEPAQEVVKETKLNKKQQSDLQDTGEDLYSVIHFTDKLKSYGEGSRNNYIHLFACNANRKGFSLTETMGFAVGYFTDMQQSEVETTVKSAYQHNSQEYAKFKKTPKPANGTGKSNGTETPGYSNGNKQHNGIPPTGKATNGTATNGKAVEEYTPFWKKRIIKKGKGPEQYEVTTYELKRVEFTDFLFEQGFHLIDTDSMGYQICHSKDGIIQPVEPKHIKTHVFTWCKKNVDREIEEMLRKGQKQFFAGNELDALHTKNVSLKMDTETESYFYFNNCWVTVTKDDITCKPYSELDEYIWAGTKKKHDFTKQAPVLLDKKGHLSLDVMDCEFAKFIYYVGWNPNNPEEKDFTPETIEQRFECMCSAIGFLLDSYKHPADRKGIFAVDHKIGDLNEQNGRTGKSIIAKAIEKLKVVAPISGKKFDPKYQFCYEQIKMDSQVINFNDMPKNFDVESIFEVIADDYSVNRRNNGFLNFNYNTSAKVLVSTNFTPKGAGDSYSARMHIIEFSDYFSAKHNPYKEFGHGMFSSAWDDKEWNRFYNFMLGCVVLFKEKGLVPYPNSNFDARKMANEVNAEFIDFMDYRTSPASGPEAGENILGKKKLKTDLLNEFNKIYQELYSQKLKPHTFHKWVKQYCKHHGLFFNPHKSGGFDKSNGHEFYTIATTADFKPNEVGLQDLFKSEK